MIAPRFKNIAPYLPLGTATIVTAVLLIRGSMNYYAGVRGDNYSLAFGEILVVTVYGLLSRAMKPAIEMRFPGWEAYLIEKPGVPYIAAFLALLLVAALLNAFGFRFLMAQIANVSYFMLVWGVLREFRAAMKESPDQGPSREN